MDYNTKRMKLPMPEYGRNIQKMVNHLLTIEDREKRNRASQTVIDVMGNLYPYLRDVPEFKHKLWDHLAIMTDFKLDIDYPYELPSPDILKERPGKVPYSQHNLKYRHYGLVITKMIEVATKMEGDKQRILIQQIANQMKKLYLAWNKDSVDDQKIINDLKELSDNKLPIPADMKLVEVKYIMAKKKKKKK